MLGAFIRRHNPNDTGLKIPEYFCRHSIANNVFFLSSRKFQFFTYFPG